MNNASKMRREGRDKFCPTYTPEKYLELIGCSTLDTYYLKCFKEGWDEASLRHYRDEASLRHYLELKQNKASIADLAEIQLSAQDHIKAAADASHLFNTRRHYEPICDTVTSFT